MKYKSTLRYMGLIVWIHSGSIGLGTIEGVYITNKSKLSRDWTIYKGIGSYFHLIGWF